MFTAQRVYQMLGNETLWETAISCDRILTAANVPYSICGGVAVCLHGYQRNTVDLDLVVRRTDADQIREQLTSAGYQWNDVAKEFQTKDGLAIQFLIAGEKAGKESEVKIVEPLGEDNVETRDGVSVVRLSRLIEMKLACGMGDLRRTHKDFADVVELIVFRNLDSSFGQLLHKSLRKTFRELVRNAKSA